MNRWSLIALAALVAACSQTPGPVAVPPAEPSPSSTAAPVTRFAGKAFTTATRDQLMAAKPVWTPGGKYYLRGPEFRIDSQPKSPMESGNMWTWLELGSPFPAEPPLPLASLRAGELGAAPSDPSAIAPWLAPVAGAWAADAVLVTTYGYNGPCFAPSEGFDATATKDIPGILKNAGWPLLYRSDARREALYVYPSGLALLVGWGSPAYTAETAPIRPADAIARYVAAMRDPAARSTEEATDRDFYLGFPFKDLYGAGTPGPGGRAVARGVRGVGGRQAGLAHRHPGGRRLRRGARRRADRRCGAVLPGHAALDPEPGRADPVLAAVAVSP